MTIRLTRDQAIIKPVIAAAMIAGTQVRHKPQSGVVAYLVGFDDALRIALADRAIAQILADALMRDVAGEDVESLQATADDLLAELREVIEAEGHDA